MELPLFNSFQDLSNLLSIGMSDFGSLHPLVIHFPIALLFVAPFFIVLGLLFPKPAKVFYVVSLILMALGTFFIFLAVSTGEVASEPLVLNPEVVSTLEIHVRLSEQSRLLFSVLTGILTCYILFLSFLHKKFGKRIHVIILLLFLLIYAYGLVMISNTAHQGGKLVHHHGIKSNLYNNPD